VLHRLLESERVAVVGIVRSTRVLESRFGFVRGACEQVRRSGLAYSIYLLCATSLSELVGGHATGGTLAQLAARRGIPVAATRDINEPAGRDYVRRLDPDLLVSAFFNQRLGEAVLAVARCGGVNIHPSLLPDFKGVDPVFHAWLNGEARLGVTVHWMVPALDAGNILGQREVTLAGNASLFEATAQLFRSGAQLLIEALEKIERGEPGIAQAPGGRYDSWPTPQQVAQFRRHRRKLVRAADFPKLWWRRASSET
jgi:methionyl-tRNA formyltransferase